ncbi:MAG: PBP1A family penicillin-binding protein [Spirochaetaceae bacterium]|jgi:penicillin-binding protein 1A|nr:PBP1A family penicillin-binding protein [Spirochaetaceae bacterium]
MAKQVKRKESFLGGVFARVAALVCVVLIAAVAAGLGLALAYTENTIREENFTEFAPDLPTKVLDIHGNLVTEFTGEQKRELVTLAELPRHLINAALAREDPAFFRHKGFTVRAIARAFYGQIRSRLFGGNTLGGGSTITQQVAGTLYTDRTEYTLRRKIVELWWAIQMERRFTKNEILEIYLNQMYMGPGVYGVEAASKYYFGHSAREITLAEAALLVVQLSAPTRYNPIANPNVAMAGQQRTLESMIELGYTTREEADASFKEYWESYDYTRVSQSAYFDREDKAPWFSEYVRRQLDTMMYQSMDYYRDGYTVRTTLDLDFQMAADKYMADGITHANEVYGRSAGNRLDNAEGRWIPVVNLLSLYFDVDFLAGTAGAQNQARAMSRYTKQINPIADMAALLFGLDGLQEITNAGFEEMRNAVEQNVVEGALVCIENETGYVKAIVGGSKFDRNNQWIRAIQGQMMPGSSFKPLYYSAAIDSRQFTPSSLIYDVPVVFHTENGTPYIPLNFRGEWQGTVLLYNALAQSMNVPSLKVLDTIGFDAAINRAAALLGITDPEVKRRTFPRVYPMGLGIISIAPIQMARAFATFANEGREVEPIAILSIEDRNGRVVIDNERNIRLAQRQKGKDSQIVSPQNAYVMTQLLKQTVEIGTLRSGAGYGAKFSFIDEAGKRYRIAAAGKTGTTQNWSDAWTVGFTPYYTTAIWFGFDRPGNSLGLDLTGATLAGPIWGDFMREIHMGLPARDFTRPVSGIVDVTVCAKSGQLLTPQCNEGSITLPFLQGTEPHEYCSHHSNAVADARQSLVVSMRRTVEVMTDNDPFLSSLAMPKLDPSALALPPTGSRRVADEAAATGREDTDAGDADVLNAFELPDYNYLMD